LAWSCWARWALRADIQQACERIEEDVLRDWLLKHRGALKLLSKSPSIVTRDHDEWDVTPAKQSDYRKRYASAQFEVENGYVNVMPVQRLDAFVNRRCRCDHVVASIS
jgi:hypothetical protein